jgi:hypothetical protein
MMKEVLQPLLPSPLRARSEERILLETTEGEEAPTSYRSDVAVVDVGRRSGAAKTASAAGATATIEPILVEYHTGPVFDRFVQIIDRTAGNRVVTAIELLSPWNKGPGTLNKAYRKKLDDYARGGVTIVEIDLLRFPPRDRLPIAQVDLPPRRRTPYLTCVQRAGRQDMWEIYPMKLREPLPRIPIPLRQTDGDIGLDLQPLIDRAYVAGGHDDIDYSRPVDPPLDPEDAAWADELLKAAGHRAQT